MQRHTVMVCGGEACAALGQALSKPRPDLDCLYRMCFTFSKNALKHMIVRMLMQWREVAAGEVASLSVAGNPADVGFLPPGKKPSVRTRGLDRVQKLTSQISIYLHFNLLSFTNIKHQQTRHSTCQRCFSRRLASGIPRFPTPSAVVQ